MALDISDTEMTSDITAVRAEFRQDAAADGQGAWIISSQPARLLTRQEAIAAMWHAEQEARAS